MKKKIIFQKCNFNYIYFLLFIFAYILMLIFDNGLDPDYVKENATKENKNKAIYLYEINKEILKLFSLNLSGFIAIIPYLITKKLLKSKKDSTNDEHKEQIKLIYNELNQTDAKKKMKKLIIYFTIISVLDFLKDFIFVLYYITFPDKKIDSFPFSNAVIFDIILQFICSYLILKIHFYKLQHFSLYLNVVIFIIILALDLVEILKNKIIKGRIYVFYPFYLIFYRLVFAYGKIVILYGYISIYKLLYIKKIIKLFFNGVFSLIILKVNKEIFIIFAEYFSDYRYILITIGKTIIYFFTELFYWIIIDRFSPNHTPLILLGEELYNFILDLILTKKFYEMGWHKYIRICLYFISFIGVILHNEIVVINICGLASDTKYFLDVLVKIEEEYTNSDDPNILKRFETLEMLELVKDDSQENEVDKQVNN